MKFISAEEFLNQPEEVQKVFLDYFKGKEGIYFNGIGTIKGYGKLFTNLGIIPALTEGDLREFIEDKTGGIETIEHFEEYNIRTLPLIGGIYGNDIYKDLGNDLLQAYWKVAIEIAKRETRR